MNKIKVSPSLYQRISPYLNEIGGEGVEIVVEANLEGYKAVLQDESGKMIASATLDPSSQIEGIKSTINNLIPMFVPKKAERKIEPGQIWCDDGWVYIVCYKTEAEDNTWHCVGIYEGDMVLDQTNCPI